MIPNSKPVAPGAIKTVRGRRFLAAGLLVALAIVAALARAGTRVVFGVPGGGPNLDVVGAAGAAGLRFVLTHFDRIEYYVPNRDLDTGLVVKPGGYPLTDRTYAELLGMITQHPEKVIPNQLKHDLLDYYADPNAPIMTKKDPQKWEQVQANLKTLETMKTIGELDPLPLEIEEGN